jgi:hypothetical protein
MPLDSGPYTRDNSYEYFVFSMAYLMFLTRLRVYIGVVKETMGQVGFYHGRWSVMYINTRNGFWLVFFC